MGSNLLDLNGNQLWLRLDSILNKHYETSPVVEKLKNPQISVQATEPVSLLRIFGIPLFEHYKKTKAFFLKRGFVIREKRKGWAPQPDEPTGKYFFDFPYDWRQSAVKIADHLKDFIDNIILQEFPGSADIHFVAHSHSGLVTRAYLWKHGAANIKSQILLGPPNHGSPKAYSILRTGYGFFISDSYLLREFVLKGVLHYFFKYMAQDLPGVYELLPNERYQSYFPEYGYLVTFMGATEKTIRSTYFKSESKIFPTAPQMPEKYYSLDNETLVEDALKFHKDLGPKTYLPSRTFVMYGTNLTTISGVDYSVNRPDGTIIPRQIGDGTVPEKSAYDLEGLVDANGKPNPSYAFAFKGVDHSSLRDDPVVLSYVLDIIEPNRLGSWLDLINFVPPSSVQTALKSRSSDWKFHKLDDAHGPINLDYYPVKVDVLPVLGGNRLTAEQFLSHIRLNLNDFVDTNIAKFSPLDNTDAAKWASGNPLNAVVHIDMEVFLGTWSPRDKFDRYSDLILGRDPVSVPLTLNPDDGSVVVSSFEQKRWVFSTIKTPGIDWSHPVSGNREFGFINNSDGSYTFYTRGADRPTQSLDDTIKWLIFSQADDLWKSFQQGIFDFVESKQGSATKEDSVRYEESWEFIKRKYYNPTTNWL